MQSRYTFVYELNDLLIGKSNDFNIHGKMLLDPYMKLACFIITRIPLLYNSEVKAVCVPRLFVYMNYP